MMDYPLGGVGNAKALKYELNWIISPLMKAIHRVNSDVNTDSAWDNPSDLIRQYKGKVQRDEASNPQYNGEYVSLVAGF
jgi:hypothetical protein